MAGGFFYEVDFSALPSEHGGKAEVNVIFGSGTLYIPEDLPLKIRASSAFGSVQLPDHNQVSFGDYNYSQGEDPVFTINASAVFGALKVRKR